MESSEMPYERPDLDDVKATLSALTERLKSAPDYTSTKVVFLEKETELKHLSTVGPWPISATLSTPGTNFATGR